MGNLPGQKVDWFLRCGTWQTRFSRLRRSLDFAGGIGEDAPVMRSRICEKLDFLGLKLVLSCNSVNSGVISSHVSRVTAWAEEDVFELVISAGFREHSPSGRVEPQARRGFNDLA